LLPELMLLSLLLQLLLLQLFSLLFMLLLLQHEQQVGEEQLQRFVNLVLQTGAHFRFRWNEQATLGMVWHTFVREGEYKEFDFPYRHQDFTG
jgi:hypothetical protein